MNNPAKKLRHLHKEMTQLFNFVLILKVAKNSLAPPLFTSYRPYLVALALQAFLQVCQQ